MLCLSPCADQMILYYSSNYQRIDAIEREKNDDTLIVVLIVLFFVLLPLMFLIALDLGRLLQLLTPDIVGALLVHVGEDNVKDVAVPFCGLALDTFADVLREGQYRQ